MKRNNETRNDRNRHRSGRGNNNWRDRSASRGTDSGHSPVRGRPFRGHGSGRNAQRVNDRSLGDNEERIRSQRNKNDNKPNRTYNQRQMGFKALEELIEDDDIDNIILVLSNGKKGFKELLSSKLSPDMIVLVVKVLTRICDSVFNTAKSSVLQFAVESDFAEQVTNFVNRLVIQNTKDKMVNKYFWKDPDEFWHNIIKISKHYNDLLPSISCDFTVKLLKSIKFSIPGIEDCHSIHISDDIKNEVAILLEVVGNRQKEIEEKERKKKEVNSNLEHEEDPPDDFREISVYPSAIEITTSMAPYLRKNIVKGAYPDINTYLDIQFRLLREDFVLPLRKGICGYIEDPRKKLQDIKVYKNVKFLCAESVNDQNCQKIQFDFSKKITNFEFENSKRFMFGSLLCFTDDGFKTLLFGKVVERKPELLQKGQLIVGFNTDMELPGDLYDTSFLLIESKVYFEPYYQVLNVLKNTSVEYFPMERYIIQVRTDTRPPQYLLKIDPVFYTIEFETFWPLDWRDRKFYGLNEAQNEAFRSALTREFAIIQGPPGTGKTFLGLKIAHTLLENKNAWYKGTPMLVICFTNHALDQFLEGLLPVTSKIIRVGGQSKNSKLNEYNIRNQKRNTHISNAAVSEKHIQVRNLRRNIENINEYLNKIEKFESIADFGIFAGLIPDYSRSWFYNAPSDKIIKWLFGDQSRQFTKRKVTNVQHDRPTVNGTEDNPLQNEENENNGRESAEIVDDVFQDLEIEPMRELIGIKSLANDIKKILAEIHNLPSMNNLSVDEMEIRRFELDVELQNLENQLEYLKFRLEEAELENLGPAEYVNLQNPHFMPPDDRWKLYFQWLNIYKEQLLKRKAVYTNEFRDVFAVYSEMRDIEDTNVMKEALVIGMTTTGAARLNSSLKALKSPIVIVEEAAEVLEAHIISALTTHCQHLILIGDHQQLKPSTASYEIETKYKLNISLFQRMVDNHVECHTLNIQHRMRPEIANLIRPSIYPVLDDHETVFDRPNILGVDHNLFFIDHEHLENVCNDNSKKNVHESKFLMQLAKHLVLNGYEPENIIILAAYLGQMFEMQRERRIHRNLLENVRIAVLDNYQGEERDIVLLSLVRSNKENKIGFLMIENRVCVALSRARNGFYIMGNMKQLCQSSKLWPQIETTLKNQDAIGSYLTLRCQIHQHQITKVTSEEDFLKVPQGGCSLLCDAQLKCGHCCTRICHILDREHTDYKCIKQCTNILCEDPTHICQKYCYQECGPCTYPVRRKFKCGHEDTIACHLDPEKYNCQILVNTELPCGHKTDKHCYIKLDEVKCPTPCDIRVEPCGHACLRKCHVNNDPDHLQYNCRKPCERKFKGCTSNEDSHKCTKACFEECPTCEIQVLKKRTKCKHAYKVPCFLDPDTITCTKPCKKLLPCSHHCQKECEEPCGDCKVLVEKIVPDCNHVIKIKCAAEADRQYCDGICPRILPCGHICKKKCNEVCRTRCKELVDCNIPSPCGHTIKKIQCFLKDNRDPIKLLANCSEPCRFKLQCEHICSGTCGDCLQGRFHKKCSEKCGAPLVCNHECTIPCREACQPCKELCSYRCKHSKCQKKCGQPCTKCKERCPRRCSHQICKRRCGDMCNVPPCTEPCQRKIKCGHRCIGFCGDPCPTLCRECDNEELTEFFFGTEDEEDARFVLLVDCGHVVESSGMEQWLESDKDEIKPKVCPKCKTVITLTQRYSDYVKQNISDIQEVKKQLYGTSEENTDKIIKLNTELDVLIHQLAVHGAHKLSTNLSTLHDRLRSNIKGRRQHINKIEIAAIRAKTDLFSMLLEPLQNDKINLNSTMQSFNQIQFISNCIVENVDSISKQQSEDIMLEIDRFYKWLQFERINYKYYLYKPEVKHMVEGVTQLLESPRRFTKSLNDVVKTHLEALKKETASNIALTDAERKDIVKAMGFKQGHWYKCPNGHPYCIADCGGAMVESVCNECGAKIGGTHHRLLSTNRVATEMDGARFGAWSAQADMANYRLD